MAAMWVMWAASRRATWDNNGSLGASYILLLTSTSAGDPILYHARQLHSSVFYFALSVHWEGDTQWRRLSPLVLICRKAHCYKKPESLECRGRHQPIGEIVVFKALYLKWQNIRRSCCSFYDLVQLVPLLVFSVGLPSFNSISSWNVFIVHHSEASWFL